MKRVLISLAFLYSIMASFAQTRGGTIRRPTQKAQVSKPHAVQKKNSRPTVKHVEQITIDPMYRGPVAPHSLQPVVVFSDGKSKVEESQLGNIDMVVAYMNNHLNEKILIRGYTYLGGSHKLSEDRAVAVKKILINSYGVNPKRLIANGMGATDSLSEIEEWNNRVEFYPIHILAEDL